MISSQQIKQELWFYIEQLSTQRLKQLLSLIKLLWFKEQRIEKETTVTDISQQQILEELDQIRARVEQNYGVYQGDILAEVRADRDQQLNLVYGWSE